MTDVLEQRVVVGRIEDFPIGVCRLVSIADREIGVIHLPNDVFRAVLNRCPHRGAPVCRGIVGGTWPPCAPGELSYAKDGEVLVCPWHGWQFDLNSGRELFQSSSARLKLYETRVTAGHVEVVL
jgi:3-phenylpropionate/trans-cinnamate dioxygenase ferredoxin subunit